jgi:hypothetical protein
MRVSPRFNNFNNGQQQWDKLEHVVTMDGVRRVQGYSYGRLVGVMDDDGFTIKASFEDPPPHVEVFVALFYALQPFLLWYLH